MNSMSFEAGHLYGAQRRAVGPDVDEKFDLESIRVNRDEIKLISPHTLKAVGPVGEVRAEEEPQQEADAVVSETAQSGYVDRSSAGSEAAPFYVVRTLHERDSEGSDLLAIHGSIGVHDDENVTLRNFETGAQRRPFTRNLLLDNPSVGPQHFRHAFRIV